MGWYVRPNQEGRKKRKLEGQKMTKNDHMAEMQNICPNIGPTDYKTLLPTVYLY